MGLKLIVVGKTKKPFFEESEKEYLKRLNKYCKLNYTIVSSSKKSDQKDACLKMEEYQILKNINAQDFLILLDEKGKQYSSRAFASQLNERLVRDSSIVFAIGGAFGFSKKVYERANMIWSLSSLTFPHHMVRTIFLEQLYRSFTILNGENYHND
ncbi:23S rRNA (pseudouridine(1915)-N(3))-methyltransferase RlmH [Bacteroidia bacterium]|nr:23S rRNA (pseudouridine(1915)-N(3))-methyltransferase RlmH [Bacteroidia bacterium]